MNRNMMMAALLSIPFASSYARADAAPDAIKDASYNMPPAVTAMMGVDEAMTKMETAVKPEVLEAFKTTNAAPFWLFGEDRQLAVRNNIVPAHWFENGTLQYGKFSGTARPGEFYVFQICVLAGDKEVSGLVPRVKFNGLDKVVIHPVTSLPVAVQPGEVKPVWMGLQLPSQTKAGDYHGVVSVGEARLAVALKVEGAPLTESGTMDAWRLARLKWLDSTIGESETVVTAPFTPIRVSTRKRTLDILGRRITLGENGIPSQYESFFSGSNTRILRKGTTAFSAPASLACTVGGQGRNLDPGGLQVHQTDPGGRRMAGG